MNRVLGCLINLALILSIITQSEATEYQDQDTNPKSIFVKSPLPALLRNITVCIGQEVKAGDLLFVVEAMKMETRILADAPGVIDSIHYQVGDEISINSILMTLLPPGANRENTHPQQQPEAFLNPVQTISQTVKPSSPPAQARKQPVLEAEERSPNRLSLAPLNLIDPNTLTKLAETIVKKIPDSASIFPLITVEGGNSRPNSPSPKHSTLENPLKTSHLKGQHHEMVNLPPQKKPSLSTPKLKIDHTQASFSVDSSSSAWGNWVGGFLLLTTILFLIKTNGLIRVRRLPYQVINYLSFAYFQRKNWLPIRAVNRNQPRLGKRKIL